MKWSEAIKRFKLKRIYTESIYNEKLMSEEIRSLGSRWLEKGKKPSLFLHGCAGCGKTYFAIMLLRALVNKGHEWINFVRSDDLDRELLDSINEHRESDVLDKYSEVPILFIDDLGVERETDRLRQQYCSIIDRRTSDSLTTVYTSNFSIDKIHETLGDRIASRLRLCYDIKFPDVDIRQEIPLQEI